MEQALKKFVACIYLKNGKATRGLADHTVVSNDPVELSLTYAAGGVDAILIFDQSDNDARHDETIGIIREICASAGVPV